MEKRNILNQNRRDIDFNKSINSGFTEEDMINSDQKKMIADQKAKLDKMEEISEFITLSDIKLKFFSNLEKSSDLCINICDKSNSMQFTNSFISTNAYPCMMNCFNKRHASIKKCYEILSKDQSFAERDDIDYDSLYEEPEIFKDS